MNVLDQIVRTPKPADLALWWKEQSPATTATALDADENDYLEFFTSNSVEPIFRIGQGIASQGNLTDERRAKAAEVFKGSATSVTQFINRENRRRIVAHYVWTHPATVQYELGLYRLTRDSNPIAFLAERFYELFSGKEAFTGDDSSRIKAAVDLLIPLAISRVLRWARISAPAGSQARPLTSPIYDLPAEGGGVRINGRLYTEHALERMAPDTPQIRAELRSRVIGRLRRLGVKPESEAWNACLARALQKIDPRGVPPSVVEAEINSPGSTNVKVITARMKTVVVTVIPRHG